MEFSCFSLLLLFPFYLSGHLLNQWFPLQWHDSGGSQGFLPFLPCLGFLSLECRSVALEAWGLILFFGWNFWHLNGGCSGVCLSAGHFWLGFTPPHCYSWWSFSSMWVASVATSEMVAKLVEWESSSIWISGRSLRMNMLIQCLQL